MTRKRSIKLLMSIEGRGSRVIVQNLMNSPRYRGKTNAETVENISTAAGLIAFSIDDHRTFEKCVEIFEKARSEK